MKLLLATSFLATLSVPLALASGGTESDQAFQRPVTFGLTAGVPIVDPFLAGSAPHLNYSFVNHRYILGPTVEFRLPNGLGLELDGLFNRLDFRSSAMGVDVTQRSHTTANSWEFPLLLKYRLSHLNRSMAPFLEAGSSFRVLSDLNQTRQLVGIIRGPVVRTDSSLELQNRFTPGFVVGGGIDLRAGPLHIAPQIRYTRWGWDNFQDPTQVFRSDLNQVGFMVGIRF